MLFVLGSLSYSEGLLSWDSSMHEFTHTPSPPHSRTNIMQPPLSHSPHTPSHAAGCFGSQGSDEALDEDRAHPVDLGWYSDCLEQDLTRDPWPLTPRSLTTAVPRPGFLSAKETFLLYQLILGFQFCFPENMESALILVFWQKLQFSTLFVLLLG